MRAWLGSQARTVLALARGLAGLRLTVRGSIPPTSCVVVMNHQSLFDIPVGISLIGGPYPVIPARASYRRGIPGISVLMRLARYPSLAQGPRVTRAERAALLAAADEVALGEQSLILFPEGHRTRDGEILPFMSAGLKQVLVRARERPVYAVVVDGLWPVRTLSDVALRLAGTSASAVILGPYRVPSDDRQLPGFIESLRDQMIETLGRLRPPARESAALAAQPSLAG